ncbi:MAG: NAD(P)-dependent alcohol dehydrogenase [Myxococcaceae bacterium]|nr:NAD(P)-dependent alcohol dehydrogenase [Myxococcaceae bacterium]
MSDGTFSAATSPSATEPLALVTMPQRPLGARDVRIKVRAIGVNPVDWKMRSGGPLRFAHRFVGPSGPLVVGVDFAGDVVEAGSAADLKRGTRVVGATNFARKQLGSYATEVVVRDDQCAVLPDAVSYDVAACLPVPGATMLAALGSAGAPPAGSRVLVLGASGGVGLTALQISRALKLTAVGVCSSRNTAVVERFGATAVDYTKGDPLEAARAHGPYDLILHAVGSATYPLDRCRPLLSSRGVVVLVVVRAADVPSFTFSRRVAKVLGKPERTTLEPLVAWAASGALEPIIEARFPLAEAERAHQVSKTGKVVGKLLLVP